MTKTKEQQPTEEQWKAYFKHMDEEEAQAKVEYKRIMEEDKDKTLLDILPPEFRRTKRSIIKRGFLGAVKETTEHLNQCPLYEGRVFTEKEVARYGMTGTSYSNFYLAYQFIPKKDSMDFSMKFFDQWRGKGTDEEQKAALKKYHDDNKATYGLYQELDYHLRRVIEAWEAYESRQKVKQGKPVNNYDIEKDGFPRTGRGSLCSLFVPVNGDFRKKQYAPGTIELYNPRTRKAEVWEITRYKKEDNVYEALTSKGKKVFLADYQDVANAWDALFSINKEIFSGWWNRVMYLNKRP